jgi:uncharacterized membrane protein YraQ (UPF0718 family)
MNMTDLFLNIFSAAWQLLLQSAPYVVFGLLISGVLSTFLNSQFIARHLGQGRVLPVLKAALFGVPLPLCSCGVLPAAMTLKQQGANRGAISSFLIATPESGVDSIAVSYALLDPFLTIVRPVAALLCAIVAGIVENLFPAPPAKACVDRVVCSGETALRRSLTGGFRYAFTDVWQGMAGWFFVGLLLAGVITALIPADWMEHWLGGGVSSLLIMLVVGVPIYICASASTPIAAALILQGVSPGAALVFLLAGPATNVTSLTVLIAILGKRGTLLYLAMLSSGAVLAGYLVDLTYRVMAWSPQAQMGVGAELIGEPVEKICVAILMVASLPLVVNRVSTLLGAGRQR